MKIRFKHIILTGLTGILALSSCSEQMDDIESSSQIILATPQVAEHTETRATSTAPTGNYLFGWKSKAKKDILTSVFVQNDGTIGKIGVYWENIIDNATLTLSNVGNFTEKDNQTEPIDILWGKKDNQNLTNSALQFTLNHKMAQAKIELTIPNGWTITSIQMTDLKKQYTFSNLTGKLEAVGELTTIDIDKDTRTVMLPPQNKDNNSRLTVTATDKDGKERTFSHKLPYAMAQNPSGGNQWEDVILKFREGYILKIAASITDGPNDEIHFTYATLTDWSSKTESTISVRPAGIYTVGDWNKLAETHNADSGNTNVRLNKYGTYSSGQWVFTIQQDINMTDKEVTPLKGFSGTLKAAASYHIIGKTADELGVEGKLDGEVFQTTN